VYGPDKQWHAVLRRCRNPARAARRYADSGLKALFDGLNPERIMGVAAVAVGAGRLALDRAAAYAREREVWGQADREPPGGLASAGRGQIELELAKLMTQKAAALYDAGAPAGEPSNMAKFAAREAAIRCVDRAIQAHGGNGFALEYGLAQLWWGVRLTRTAPVSREMILNYVAEHSLASIRSACRGRTNCPLGLAAHSSRRGPAARRKLRHLVEAQRAVDQLTDAGFPVDQQTEVRLEAGGLVTAGRLRRLTRGTSEAPTPEAH